LSPHQFLHQRTVHVAFRDPGLQGCFDAVASIALVVCRVAVSMLVAKSV
jgi:hypothetical protein